MTTSQGEDPIAHSSRRPVYVERVNAVVDYIESNLADDLTLETLSEIAHFSPYHFHRVFSAMVGETLSRFINRVRIERAASLLVQHRSRTITDVGVECGFANPSSFARAFRDAFGMSATEWRNGGYQDHERMPGESYRDVIGNMGVAEGYGISGTRLDPTTGYYVWDIETGGLGAATVTIERIAPRELAYLRHTGRYQGLGEVFADIFGRLMNWAQPRGLVTTDAWVLAVYHDNPSITEDDKLRISACLTVPAGTETSGEVGRMQLDGGAYAVGRFELDETEYGRAWFALAGGWLPDSGYEPDDRLPFERFLVGRTATSADKEVVDICLPVRPLGSY